ncbi:helical backbone metal receptor [Psychroflexus tropicus]|uniref:helical backbone metal receptor n=1 Tax=Psychroflexus tropicus TaxID=197345 RepID=UPI00037F4A26|nr:helical backbone metal receptor [Psychroflexus tropicus]
MKDQLQRDLTIKHIPSKIVCLVPSLTELLVDLGLENQIIGVTKFCVHPEHIRKSTSIIGGTKTVKVDKVKTLEPDFILANKEENELEHIESLAQSFPVYVSDIKSIEDLLSLIQDLASIFEINDQAEKLINKLKSSYDSFTIEMSKMPKLKVAYFIWRDPWMVAGSSTFIDYMLNLNNLENIFGSSSRYPEIELDQLKHVDYVFLSSEPFPFKQKHKGELPLDASKIQIVDGEYFSWYGSRMLKAIEYFRTLRDKL